MAEKLATLLDSVDDLLTRVLVEDKKQKDILKQLEQIENPYKVVLEKVYIQGKTLVTVASEMKYSYEHMKHINGIALLKFDKVDTKKH